MYSEKPIKLSATSGLNLFQECPRCFWLHHCKGVHRPRGPFPSLPGGMDSVLRKYYVKFAGKLPPEIRGEVKGVLVEDRSIIGKRLQYEDDKLGAALWGTLDECLIDGKTYIPLDFKTRASAPKEGASEKYYQTQLDTYALLLAEKGYHVADFAYLVYYFPNMVLKERLIRFHTEVVKLSTDPERARRIFGEAVKCLRGKMPQRHSTCSFCCWNGE